ncbi:major capsid protein [Bifidobacterium margollesii]|uniref:Major capsid protein n=1 Tax=Bifidobacterium margollesii TaxID=2020964 RepID=A0A2N5JBH3_9BIFI|nr:hypothetical protein [Bifidobacterium margollesii]PLS31558.1 major capsid protein [Bifidobacterium margollesii]
MADPTMNRQSGGLDLTPETQNLIWQTAAYQSAFMQLVPQINLPGKGVRVPIITGDPVADWVQEGGREAQERRRLLHQGHGPVHHRGDPAVLQPVPP